MEDFEGKLTISEETELETDESSDDCLNKSSRSKSLILLRRFLSIQQRRAEAYAKLREYKP